MWLERAEVHFTGACRVLPEMHKLFFENDLQWNMRLQNRRHVGHAFCIDARVSAMRAEGMPREG
jgi:hypothetical protein